MVHQFEYDSQKSVAIEHKHGINFIDAQLLWEDSELIEVKSRNTEEPRFLVIGKINSKYWTAITTSRDDKIRLISVRRSRVSEIKLYES